AKTATTVSSPRVDMLPLANTRENICSVYSGSESISMLMKKVITPTVTNSGRQARRRARTELSCWLIEPSICPGGAPRHPYYSSVDPIDSIRQGGGVTALRALGVCGRAVRPYPTSPLPD